MSDSAYFITGSTGYLGRHLVEAVTAHDPGAEISLLVRRPGRLRLPPALAGRLCPVVGDVAEPETYATALQGVSTVIHSAALISFRPADQAALHRANVAGTASLLKAACAAGCQTFIHISSISAIGRPPGRLADESHDPDPAVLARDAYGWSKVLAEREVMRCAEALHVTLLNPSVIIGPGSRLWGRALRWLRRLPAVPMLTTLNSFVDVRDVARAAILALAAPRSGERYIVTSENVDMVSFARQALGVLGSRAVVFPVPRGWLRAGDAVIAGLDRLRLNPGVRRLVDLNVDKAYSNAKIQRDLGWAPRYALEQSLRDMLAPE
jgi:dihydroflavonol-4-reductase